ncbi:MAG: hypothetical protein UR81_C0038G0009 [Candidatus Levybacteria bacterium GW2011_GWB1_35_5]|nr:MAG: hypothetical protein UR81_C0038G0009 [Candidatus Levybacteria bacterium GW2011_GWB1_35_5]
MKNKLILVDSDAFVALAKEDDTNHRKAVEQLESLIDKQVNFITSNYVFSETVTVLSIRISHEAAIDFIKRLKSTQNPFSIKRVDEELEEKAIEVFKSQTSKNTSFVDCTNIALSRELKVDAIFSFDEVYKKNGLPTVG